MLNDSAMKLTREGDSLVRSWKHAQDRLARAKQEVNSAECELSNATNALGKWLMPTDAKDGETFAIWYVDSLVQVEKVKNGMHDFRLSLRARGREWAKL